MINRQIQDTSEITREILKYLKPCVKASQLAYEDSNDGKNSGVFVDCENEGWEIFNFSNHISDENIAISERIKIVFSEKEKAVIIAFRGTTLSYLDLNNDARIFCGEAPPIYEDAKRFLDGILQDEKFYGHQVIYTGHSLGGSVAEYLAIEDNTTWAITFDSPGLHPDRDDFIGINNIYGFMGLPNLVNTSGRHFGNIFITHLKDGCLSNSWYDFLWRQTKDTLVKASQDCSDESAIKVSYIVIEIIFEALRFQSPSILNTVIKQIQDYAQNNVKTYIESLSDTYSMKEIDRKISHTIYSHRLDRFATVLSSIDLNLTDLLEQSVNDSFSYVNEWPDCDLYFTATPEKEVEIYKKLIKNQKLNDETDESKESDNENTSNVLPLSSTLNYVFYFFMAFGAISLISYFLFKSSFQVENNSELKSCDTNNNNFSFK